MNYLINRLKSVKLNYLVKKEQHFVKLI